MFHNLCPTDFSILKSGHDTFLVRREAVVACGDFARVSLGVNYTVLGTSFVLKLLREFVIFLIQTLSGIISLFL
jgi:hypothetical protein